MKIRLACCKRSLAPGLPLGDRATATGREPGPPSSVECSKLPPASRPARVHTLTPRPEQRGVRPPPCARGSRGRAKKGGRARWRCGHRQTDRQTPMHHGRCLGGGGAADARGLTGRRDRLPAGTEASRGSPWRAQAGGLLRCSRGARATRVACQRRARGARGGCRARCSAGRAGARSAPGERRRQVSCALGSRAGLSPPGRPAARSSTRARPRPVPARAAAAAGAPRGRRAPQGSGLRGARGGESPPAPCGSETTRRRGSALSPSLPRPRIPPRLAVGACTARGRGSAAREPGDLFRS